MTSNTRIPRGIRILLFALAANSFATGAIVTILGKQVFDMTGRELDLGLLGLFEFMPILVMAPIAGTLADRFDRRYVFAVGLAFEALASLGLWWYVATDPTAVGPIFGIVLVYGAARALAAPASRSLPIDMAPIHIVERVVALRSVVFQSARIVGPVAAGFAFVVAIELPYLMSAVVLVAGLLSLMAIPAPTTARLDTGPGPMQALRDAWEGLRFVGVNPVLRGAITLDLFAVLFGGAVALLPAIAEDRLGVGAIGLGWLRAALGIGALAVSLVLSVRPVRRRVGRVLLVTVAIFGAATVVLGLTSSFTVAFVAILIAAGADSLSVFIRTTLVPLTTPEKMRGRVLAVENVFIGASNELGAVESGVAAHYLGLVFTVVAGGVVTLAVVVVAWRVFPELRDVDRFSDLHVGRPEP